MYLLNTNDFCLHQLCDWQWLEGDDGKVLQQEVKQQPQQVIKETVQVQPQITSTVDYSIIDEGTVIGKNVKIGNIKEKAKGITVLSRMISVEDGATISDGNIIDKSVNKGETL